MQGKVDGWELIDLKRFHDNRGYFEELFHAERYGFDCLQINHSFSKKNVVRGLHLVPFEKYVACVAGEVYSVVVDLRPTSKTYLTWTAVNLKSNQQVHVPPHCGHGFMALQDSTIIYFQNHHWNPTIETEILWSDPDLGIIWPRSDEYILSEKDRHAKTYREYLEDFEAKLRIWDGVLLNDTYPDGEGTKKLCFPN